MAGTHLTIDKAELARLDAFMAEQAARDPSGLMPRLGEYLQGSTQARFKTQTAPDGTPWAPLKQRYARRKRYNKDTVLTLRGYLRSYIHYQIPDAQTVEVGSNQKYAAIHQFGGEIRAKGGSLRFRLANGGFATVQKVTMPARPFLGISDDDRDDILDIIQARIQARTQGGAHAG